MDINKWNTEFFLRNESDRLNYIKQNYHLVPYINVNDLEYINNSLVRFRGMVQDMYDPEYYLEKCEVINTITNDTCTRNGKYTDIIYCNDNEVLDVDNSKNISSERQTFVVISVPGLNYWINEIENDKYKLKNKPETSSHNNKRPLDLIAETNDLMICNTNQRKRTCNIIMPKSSESMISKEHLLNLPIPDVSGKTCHIKIYEHDSNIKLNEVYDFIGFLSSNIVSTQREEDDFMSEMEIQTHNPPSSLIHRIHCISWSKLEYINPLLQDVTLNIDKILFLKNELHLMFTELLLGDELAAHYLLYHLLSKVYLRRDLMALGSFTLNISNIPGMLVEHYGEKVYEFLRMLVSKSHYLPMTLENMNDLTFTPKKDYACNRLTTGLLQLSEGTHLVLDETKLTSGKLNESGVKAISAIHSIIKGQKLAYDFNYYNMEFECDIPILIISEGKSLLQSDTLVVLKPMDVHVNTFNEIYEAIKKLLNPVLLNDLRVYLTTARNQPYEISDNILKIIQNDFVNLRQTNNINADDLHHLLVLSRLISIAEGKSTLDEECWKTACNLENRRKARF